MFCIVGEWTLPSSPTHGVPSLTHVVSFPSQLSYQRSHKASPFRIPCHLHVDCAVNVTGFPLSLGFTRKFQNWRPLTMKRTGRGRAYQTETSGDVLCCLPSDDRRRLHRAFHPSPSASGFFFQCLLAFPSSTFLSARLISHIYGFSLRRRRGVFLENSQSNEKVVVFVRRGRRIGHSLQPKAVHLLLLFPFLF